MIRIPRHHSAWGTIIVAKLWASSSGPQALPLCVLWSKRADSRRNDIIERRSPANYLPSWSSHVIAAYSTVTAGRAILPFSIATRKSLPSSLRPTNPTPPTKRLFEPQQGSNRCDWASSDQPSHHTIIAGCVLYLFILVPKS